MSSAYHFHGSASEITQMLTHKSSVSYVVIFHLFIELLHVFLACHHLLSFQSSTYEWHMSSTLHKPIHFNQKLVMDIQLYIHTHTTSD